MTPGPVDVKLVADRLAVVEGSVATILGIPHATLDEFLSDPRNRFATDALLRRALEALFDVARHLLAKAHGIAALEYRQVARRSSELAVIRDPDLGDRFVLMAGYRNRLTHHYDEITGEELFVILTQHVDDLRRIAEELRASAAALADRRSEEGSHQP